MNGMNLSDEEVHTLLHVLDVLIANVDNGPALTHPDDVQVHASLVALRRRISLQYPDGSLCKRMH